VNETERRNRARDSSAAASTVAIQSVCRNGTVATRATSAAAAARATPVRHRETAGWLSAMWSGASCTLRMTSAET
jgi:hypothetical protein